ncbi:MAG TPA: hypothetical protein PK054_00220 [Anaerohalosphaeraceae bacterium]|nr:hypothetical protein [Anaerohalosphaeraceae bacterium]HPP54987.1 hypothetical protein [Anaerohalosphaeraceae bacterium]
MGGKTSGKVLIETRPNALQTCSKRDGKEFFNHGWTRIYKEILSPQITPITQIISPWMDTCRDGRSTAGGLHGLHKDMTIDYADSSNQFPAASEQQRGKLEIRSPKFKKKKDRNKDRETGIQEYR